MLKSSKGAWFSSLRLVGTLLLVMLFVLSACGGDEKADKKEQTKEDTEQQDTAKEEQTTPAPIELPDVVAEYKGGKVEKQEFLTFMNTMRFLNPQYAEAEKDEKYKEQLLEAYILNGVARAKLAKDLVKDMDKEVAEQISGIQQGMDQEFGAGGFDKRLQRYSLTTADLKNYMEDRYYMMKYVMNRVSDAEMKAEYDKRVKAGELKQTIATVSHILIGLNEGQENARTKEEALKKAKEVLAELRAGADFAVAAKKYSDDPGSKDNGGTYADANVDEWVPEFREAAVTLPLNKISEPVETQFGYHIMNVSKRSQGTKSFAEYEDELRNQLAQAEFSNIMDKEVRPMITSNNLKQK